jgi:hypothetical protein
MQVKVAKMTRLENASKEKVVKIVQKWLTEEEYSIEPYPDVNTDYNFRIVKGNIVMHVGFHKRYEDSLIIVGKVGFNPQEQSMLRYTKTKHELLYELEIVFTQLNIEFRLNPIVVEGEYSIEDIQLIKTLYFDGLTKQSFFDVLGAIFNCLKLLITKFDLLGGPAPTKS